MKFKCVYIKFRFNKCSFFSRFLFIYYSQWMIIWWLVGWTHPTGDINIFRVIRPTETLKLSIIISIFFTPLPVSLFRVYNVYPLSLSIFRSLSVKIRRNLMNFNYNLLFLLSIVSAFKCFFCVFYLFIYTFWTKKLKI